jgi:hypothetical protein
MRVVLLCILIGSVVATAVWWKIDLNVIQERYSAERAGAAEKFDWNAGLASAKEQNGVLLNWAFAALTGTILLVTSSKTHAFKWINPLFLLLGPALSLLLGSLSAGLVFQRRVTFLELHQRPVDRSLNDLLLTQSNLLEYAVGVLAVFALICLVQIVGGWVDPREAKA